MARVAPRPIIARRTTSLGPAALAGPSAEITNRGNPSARPAVIELFRKSLRVVFFMSLWCFIAGGV